MSNRRDEVDQSTRDKLEATHSRIAAANSEIAAALEQSTGIEATNTPEYQLRRTHAELLDAYQELTQAIDMAERTLDALGDGHNPTPHQIKREHAERMAQTYPDPVRYLAVDLLEANRREWLHTKPATNGAQQVERHGLTTNQRDWINQVAGAVRAVEAVE